MWRNVSPTCRIAPAGFLAALTAWSLLLSCATPVPPTGGPVDSTPPSLTASDPPEGTVNFDGNRLTFFFSERLDPTSFQRALSITPEPATRPRFQVKRNRATVLLQEPLRDATTYIFTLDNTLKDLHGVALKQPIIMAISTGPEIDGGRIEGLVRNPETDRPVSGLEVFAYLAADSLLPDPRETSPDFRTQTGTDGRFVFSYLPEQSFRIVALEDRNRNRLPDPGEAFAVTPAPTIQAVRADSGLATVPMFITRIDTTPPEIRRIRSLSSRRLQVRFSEPVRLTNPGPENWLLEDSAAARPVPVRAVLAPPSDPFVVVLVTDSLMPVPHRLTPGAVADSSGNAAISTPSSVVPDVRADTVQTRFVRFLPSPPLRITESVHILAPDQSPGILLSDAADSTFFARYVTLQDTASASVPFAPKTSDGLSYTLHPLTALRESEVVVAGVKDPRMDTLYVQRFQHLPSRERGELSGVVRSDEGPVRVEIRPDARTNRVRMTLVEADSTGVFVAPGLPAAGYYLRAFVDRDRDGAWSGGQLHPFVPFEPLVWYGDSLQVRARWTTSPSDTLVIPSSPEPGGSTK